ncbi:hypothetical protein M513_09270 [Trichuris suis]|uniref:Uncharacterized protein n=1 Tax=Trichuris suis TaxID=68888 RepID=A0A085LXV7_9BILA|nr:hypothetical protein M513_09270 [Trichuris suis]
MGNARGRWKLRVRSGDDNGFETGDVIETSYENLGDQSSVWGSVATTRDESSSSSPVTRSSLWWDSTMQLAKSE